MWLIREIDSEKRKKANGEGSRILRIQGIVEKRKENGFKIKSFVDNKAILL